MRTAVCLIVRNEVKTLSEWIAHYGLLGFDTIVVIDDFSTDGSDQVIKMMAQCFDVRYLLQPYDVTTRQMLCFTKICYEYRDYDWLAFFDIDEFLVSPLGKPLTTLFETDAVALIVPWLIFGSSGHVEKPAGLVMESYLHRAPANFNIGAYSFKSMVQPAYTLRPANPHVFTVRGRYLDTMGNAVLDGRPCEVKPTKLNDQHWRLHHYYTRSKADWATRMERGALGNRHGTVSWTHFTSYDRNNVYDDSALQYVDPIKQVLLNIPT